jgi:hypothetical protein
MKRVDNSDGDGVSALQVVLAAVVVAQAERCHEGLNPDLCHNYPYCSSIHYSPYVPNAVATNHNYPARVVPSLVPTTLTAVTTCHM